MRKLFAEQVGRSFRLSAAAPGASFRPFMTFETKSALMAKAKERQATVEWINGEPPDAILEAVDG